MSDKPHCDNSGVCRPDDDYDLAGVFSSVYGTTANCIYCSKELRLFDGVWKTWDHDLHEERS